MKQPMSLDQKGTLSRAANTLQTAVATGASGIHGEEDHQGREMMTMKDLKMTMIDSTVDPHAVVHTTVTTTHSGASGEALGEGTEGDTGAHQGT